MVPSFSLIRSAVKTQRLKNCPTGAYMGDSFHFMRWQPFRYILSAILYLLLFLLLFRVPNRCMEKRNPYRISIVCPSVSSDFLRIYSTDSVENWFQCVTKIYTGPKILKKNTAYWYLPIDNRKTNIRNLRFRTRTCVPKGSPFSREFDSHLAEFSLMCSFVFLPNKCFLFP